MFYIFLSLLCTILYVYVYFLLFVFSGLSFVVFSYKTVFLHGTQWPSDMRLDFAIARSRVRLPPVAAVYQRLLSVPSLRGRLMSSSLRTTG